MVVGTDGYYNGDQTKRHLKQLLFYSNPLKKYLNGNYVTGQQPDSYIEIPLGAPGEINFDEGDNLIVQDHTWNRVLITTKKPECQDEKDNDEDELIDYPQDSDCISEQDDREQNSVYFYNSEGYLIAEFDELGNIILGGICFERSDCSTIGNIEHEFKNSAGNIVANINSFGNLCVATGCAKKSSCNPSDDSFKIFNNNGVIVSSIDYSTGELCYTKGLILGEID